MKFNIQQNLAVNSRINSCSTDVKFALANKKQLINFLNLYSYIKQSLKLKNVALNLITFSLLGKTIIVTMQLYYNSLKLVLLRKKVKQALNGSLFNKLIVKNNLFPNSFLSKNQISDISIKFLILNKEINVIKVLYLYKRIKNSTLTFFKKKRYLLLDFLRITVLLLEDKINVKLFINIIGDIFSSLTKKNHNRFFLIIKKIFKLLILDDKLNNSNNKIKGIKLQIAGRLRGKTRADSRHLIVGKVPLQSISQPLLYSKQHLYTVYGAFGLKIWVAKSCN